MWAVRVVSSVYLRTRVTVDECAVTRPSDPFEALVKLQADGAEKKRRERKDKKRKKMKSDSRLDLLVSEA